MGIRSIVAAPIRAGEKSVGLIESFSPQPNAFSDTDERVLQRLGETVLDAANRAARAENLPLVGAQPVERFTPPQGSILFASAEEEKNSNASAAHDKTGISIRLPRSYLILLTCALATIATVLGMFSAPLIQFELVPWVKGKLHARSSVTQLQTVLASTEGPRQTTATAPTVETATLDQLRRMAELGDPAAENSLGLRYAQGDGVELDEQKAVSWFLLAAQHGNVAAQSKLGSIYYSGRGVPKDLKQAYFWMVVARLSGDEASKTLSPGIRYELSRDDITRIELKADSWLRQQRQNSKTGAGQSQTAQTSKM